MELGSVKFCRLRLRLVVASYQRSLDNDFGRKAMHRPENIKGQEEKESDDVEMKSKRHLPIEFREIKGIGDNFRSSRSLCDSVNKFKDCHTEFIQRNQR